MNGPYELSTSDMGSSENSLHWKRGWSGILVMSVADLNELPIRIIVHLMRPKRSNCPITPGLVTISSLLSKKNFNRFWKVSRFEKSIQKTAIIYPSMVCLQNCWFFVGISELILAPWGVIGTKCWITKFNWVNFRMGNSTKSATLSAGALCGLT